MLSRNGWMVPPEGPRERRVWALGTLAAAAAFRVALLVSGLVSVMFETADSGEYRSLAESLLRHHVFGLDGIPKMNRTPGYPAFLALVYSTAGRSQLAVTSAQVLVDALACAMVVDIAVRSRMSRAACLTVSALAASCVFTASYSLQVMTETLYTFVLVAGVWVLPLGGLTAMTRPSARGRVALCGVLAGAATLIRPSSAVTIALLPLLLGFLLFRVMGRRAWNRQVLVTCLVFVAPAALVVGPWMLRNRITFHEEFEKPDHSHVTLLGFKTDLLTYRHWYTADFMTFKRSFEEPFIMEHPDVAPSIVRHVYPGEREEMNDAFVALRREMALSDAMVSAGTLGAFRTIGEKRYAAAPRLHLTAPLSRLAKFWIVPRVSVLLEGRHGGNVSRTLAVGLTLYNCLYVLPGLLGLWFGLRGAKPAWVAAGAVLVSQSALYAFWQSMPQSRYAVPFFPLLCLGCGALVMRVASHRREHGWWPSRRDAAFR